MKTRFHTWLLLGAVIGACDSPLDTNPTTAIDAETALTSANAVKQAVNGAYRALGSGALYGRQQVVYPDMYADNLDFTGTFQTDREFGLRAVSSTNSAIGSSGIWGAAYVGINRANNVLAAVETVSDMTDADKSRARGEALFIRALNYSILASWFGGVPIVTTPTKGIDETATAPRASLQEVYAFIEQDLETAAPLLPTGRVNGRATQAAANGLAARVYLEDGKYTQARDKATAVINNTAYRLVENYRDIFTNKHTTESLFELSFAGGEDSNGLAFWFFDQSAGGRRGFQPTASLFNAFEPNDERRGASITTQAGRRIGFKYHRIATGDDNVPILRVAEMYLIRAEANMRLGAPASTVRADINVVRDRAGLPPLSAEIDTASELIDAILQERRVELAMEGHRFFDLRRLGRATTSLSMPAFRLFLPIPLGEINVNPNLEQNEGY